jgi:hypothetical protein
MRKQKPAKISIQFKQKIEYFYRMTCAYWALDAGAKSPRLNLAAAAGTLAGLLPTLVAGN